MVERETIEANLPEEDLLLRQQDEHKYEDARAYLHVLSLLKRNKGRGVTYSSMQEDIKHAS